MLIVIEKIRNEGIEVKRDVKILTPYLIESLGEPKDLTGRWEIRFGRLDAGKD